jgi:hypothetical protein
MGIEDRFPAALKASLLVHGIDFNIDLFTSITRDYYDNQFGYDQTSKKVTVKHRFPQLILLGNGVASALHRKEGSPFELKVENQEVMLFEKGEFIQTIELPERPKYFGKTLSDGTKSELLIAVAGHQTPGFFLSPDCYYFEEKSSCRFCGFKGTRKTVGRELVSDFTDLQIREATILFQTTPWVEIPVISCTTGTNRTDAETLERVIRPIKVMYDALNPKIRIHLLTHPPNDLTLIEKYKEAGVETIAFNIEVYNRKLFEKTCPGKNKLYGYDKWMEAVMHARDVFGSYKVYCGLVWGLEPPESTLEGNEFFLENRINIASNIFHADPKSIFRNMPHQSEEELLRLCYAESEQYRRYPGVRNIFPVSMRSTLDFEIYRGDFR